MHNSYDAEIKNGEDVRFTGKKSRVATVLQFSIPFLDAPLSTVSWPFAIELTQENLQKDYFASHLQYLFSLNPPVGVNNGQFLESAEKKASSISEIKKVKDQNYQKLTKILRDYEDDRIIGKLNLTKSSSPKPILFMSGRMDLMQKDLMLFFMLLDELREIVHIWSLVQALQIKERWRI